MTVIAGTTLVPHRPEMFVDGTHPNDEGFLHCAINLHRTVGRSHQRTLLEQLNVIPAYLSLPPYAL